jgi:hypothetical protein
LAVSEKALTSWEGRKSHSSFPNAGSWVAGRFERELEIPEGVPWYPGGHHVIGLFSFGPIRDLYSCEPRRCTKDSGTSETKSGVGKEPE